jgi:hypothetical protein
MLKRVEAFSDCRTDQASGANEGSTQTGDEAIGKAQLG